MPQVIGTETVHFKTAPFFQRSAINVCGTVQSSVLLVNNQISICIK